MNTFLIMMIMLNSLIFTQTKHPLSMGLILIFQTILISFISGFFTKNFWFSYILFLIFIGGMLILFIYMASIASNEKMNFSSNILFMYGTLFSLIFLIWLILDNFFSFNMFSYNSNLEKSNLINPNNLTLFTNLFNKNNNLIMLLMVLYLLLTLIAVVKITNLFLGPLRSK